MMNIIMLISYITTFLASELPPVAFFNTLIQIILFITMMGGGLLLAKRRQLKLHGRIMGIAVVVNLLMTFIFMFPSMLSSIESIIIIPQSLITLIISHGIVGIVTGVIGLALIFKKFGNVRNWMRIVFVLWIITFITGIFVYASNF